MISIFDLEKRFDWTEEFNRIENDFMQRKLLYVQDRYCSFMSLLNLFIKEFPLNESSKDLDQYYYDYGYYDGDERVNNLRKLNFYFNYVVWLFKNKYINTSNTYLYGEQNSEAIISFFKRIDYFLEKANYKAIETNFDDRIKDNKFIFIKRDADVDSVLHIVEPSVKIDILSYLDFTIENNVVEKQNIIRRLYISIDTQTEKQLYYSNNCKKQYDDVIRVMNYVRHGQEEKLNDKDLIDLCDKVFYMYLHLIRTPIIARYRKDTIGLIAD